MIQRIRSYVNELFADAPKTKKALDLKEEVCSNLIDKFVDLTGQGMAEEEAYNAAVASIGDINELFDMLDSDKQQEDPQQKKRAALFVSTAVMLYILSLVPVLILSEVNPITGIVLMFVLIAIATALLVYYGMTKPHYRRMDDTMVEEFKEWKQQPHSKDKSVYGALSGALWLVITAVYLWISFVSGAWMISWVVFLIGVALQQVLRAALDLTRR